MPIQSTDETTRSFPYLLVISRRDHIGGRKPGSRVDGGTPGIEERARVLFVDPARGDEGCIGKGAGQVLDVRRATQTGRKDLDCSRSRVDGVRHLGRRQGPEKDRNPRALTDIHQCGTASGRDDEGGPRFYGTLGLLRGQNRPRPDERMGASRGGLDDIDNIRNRKRELHATDTTESQRVCQPCGIGDAGAPQHCCDPISSQCIEGIHIAEANRMKGWIP